ncbi:MAG TPA: sigma-70 family RNA polymerase sigma factor [Gemmataceae bacterium]|nr:sigma-70 family RNA polymerase sigma factor [Gemmataceae bacterium]
MTDAQLRSAVRALRDATAPQAPTDVQLLGRFAASRDEAAFTTLVDRHGPMVWGVCRRLLGHRQDAEDAFQATFLALARRPGAVRRRESVGGWLYGVARRVALRARRTAARTRVREQRAAEARPAEAGAGAACRELRAELDAALAGLPARYRAAIVLCYLEGRTVDQAARELGCPRGTVASRLAHGRERLRARLSRRGLALPAAALTAFLLAGSAPATVPAALRAAAAGLARSAAVRSPAVAALADGVTAGGRLPVATTLAVALVAGAGFLLRPAPAGDPPGEAPKPAKADTPKVADREPFDRFGDPLPAGAAARLGTTRLYHGRRVDTVAISPDGSLVTSTGDDGQNRLWDVKTGRELSMPEMTRNGLVFPADGKLLAADPKGPLGTYFDLATGVPITDLKIDMSAVNAANPRFGGTKVTSPDGSVRAEGGDSGIKLWEAKTNRELPALEGQPDRQVTSLRFAPDGKLLAATYPGPDVFLWDVTGRKVTRKLLGKDFQVFCLMFSADGKRVAAADGSSVTVWDVATGKWLHEYGHTYLVGNVVFTPDGRTLLTGARYNDPLVRLWNPLTGQERSTWRGHTSDIQGLALSPDGRQAVTTGQDGTLRLWDATTGTEDLRKLGDGKGWGWDAAYSPDGRTVAVGGRGVRLWDVPGRKELRRFGSGTVEHVGFSPDGRTLATIDVKDPVVRLWDVADGKELRRFAGPEGKVRSFAFSPDGRLIATAAETDVLRLWDVATGREVRHWECWSRTAPDASSKLWVVAYSPDGRMLATGHADRTVRLWEVASARELARFAGHQGGVTALKFSPNGRLLASGSWDRTALVWDVTGRLTGAKRTTPTKERLAALWDDLTADDATKAFAAIRELSFADGAVAFLRDRVRPAAAPDRERIDRLVADLDSNTFAVRERATKELMAMGDAADAAVRQALAGKPSAEARERLEALAARLDGPRSGALLRDSRAVEVLEWSDDPNAVEVLRALSGGAPEAGLTREAKGALKRRGAARE